MDDCDSGFWTYRHSPDFCICPIDTKIGVKKDRTNKSNDKEPDRDGRTQFRMRRLKMRSFHMLLVEVYHVQAHCSRWKDRKNVVSAVVNRFKKKIDIEAWLHHEPD